LEKPLKRKKRKKGYKKPKDENRQQNSWSPERIKIMIARINDLLDPLCETEGMELVHLECRRESGGRILRLYIDKPGGVTLDDCTYISRQASDILDVYFEDTGPFNLEVSSPGQNRPLGKKRDFDRFKGSLVNIKTISPVIGKKKISGVLMGISEDVVTISNDDQTVAIPYHEIVSARLAKYSPIGENPLT
jgi:ribosome maturation factor RimP